MKEHNWHDPLTKIISKVYTTITTSVSVIAECFVGQVRVKSAVRSHSDSSPSTDGIFRHVKTRNNVSEMFGRIQYARTSVSQRAVCVVTTSSRGSRSTQLLGTSTRDQIRSTSARGTSVDESTVS